ncbi:MAG: glycosyltransferase family 4 protein [Treponema sp.]|nr:glycosyltransferase family 4 protein [Treponema sp.]
MKRICLVTCGDLPVPAVQGGAVETLLQLLAEVNERGQKCEFIIISRFNEDAAEQSKSYKHTTFLYNHADSEFEKKLQFISRVLNKLCKIIFRTEIPVYSAWYRRAYKLALTYTPDFVVFEGGNMPASFSVFKKSFSQDKMVIHLHGNWFPSPFVSQLFGRVISVSKFVNDEYLSTCSNARAKLFVVLNTVNQTAFQKAVSEEERRSIRKNYGFTDDDFVIVFCGRICADKGVHELEKAVLAANKNIKLLIVGSPQYANSTTSPYLNEAMRLGQIEKGRIVFTGFVHNSEVYKLYKSCNCLALPSLWEEPCALVQIEGMTAGLPLVVTRSGGIPEYVTSDCAVILERDENLIANMTETFNKLSVSLEKCSVMSKASIGRSKEFSLERFYGAYLECFE